MPPFLPSGSILPAGLFEEGTDSFSAHDHTYKNYGIKIGTVLRVYETDDKNNLNKEVPEYDVSVVEQNENASQNSIIYQNCVTAELFGGIGEYFEYRYKQQEKVDKEGKDQTSYLQDGAQVIVTCLNGSAEKAIIIGAVKHPKRKTKLTKDDGHSLSGEFNGLSVGIDKEGAFTLSFKGKTDITGKPADEKVGGSFIAIEKDGSFLISDGNKESIRIDKTKKTLDIIIEKDISISTDENIKTTSKKDSTQKMAKWLVEASGAVSMSGEKFDIDSKGDFSVKASSFKVNSDGVVNLKGGTVEIKGNDVKIGDMVTIGPAGQPAIVMTTMFMGIGNRGAPVVCQAIGPFSSTVKISV